MRIRMGELRCKEVINIADGSRYGYVEDAEIDLETGQIQALVIPGRCRLFGLLGREPEQIFPWSAVRHFGDVMILVESGPGPIPGPRHRRQ